MAKYHHVVTLTNSRGLHQHAAEKLSDLSAQFHAEIHVCRNGIVVAAQSISGLVSLAAGQHCEIELRASGPQAQIALSALTNLIKNKFYEEDLS